jgi:hypothetical protein
MQVGDRYSLAWKYHHRIEATIVALHERHLIAKTEHRCSNCDMTEFRETLPLEGTLPYKYDDFGKLFVPMAPEDAMALPGSKS